MDFYTPLYKEQIMQGELKRSWREVNGSWRGYGGARIVEDNARIHTVKENMEMRRKEKFVYVEHPPYSPDLNPIENCWSYLKGMLARQPRHATTTAELSQRVSALWAEVPQGVINHTVDSMKKRLKEVKKSAGRPIDY